MKYVDADYTNEQSGKYRYFPDHDSIVLYNYYPDAYTKESKNEYWTISQLSSDSFVVIPKNVTVTLYGDTLNTEKEPIEIFLRRNKQRDISDIILFYRVVLKNVPLKNRLCSKKIYTFPNEE